MVCGDWRVRCGLLFLCMVMFYVSVSVFCVCFRSCAVLSVVRVGVFGCFLVMFMFYLCMCMLMVMVYDVLLMCVVCGLGYDHVSVVLL